MVALEMWERRGTSHHTTGKHGYGEHCMEDGMRVAMLADGEEAHRMLGLALPCVPMRLRFDGSTVTRVA